MEPSRGKSICVPFHSEEHYAACVTDLESFRQHLTEVFAKHPELFPAGISEGFVLHDKSWSIKQQVMLRRIALKATAGVFLVRPSFLLPYMVGRTEAVEKALYLRHWGVPFDALVYVFGRDAMYWYRAEMALGRPAHLGSGTRGLCRDHGRRRLHPRRNRDRCGFGRRAGGRVRRVCRGGARAGAHLQPSDGVHRRLGRHAERLEAPLPDGVHSPVFPPLGPQDRRTLWA